MVFSHGFRIQNLNPVAVRVTNECQPFHGATIRGLLKGYTKLLEAFAGCIHIRDFDANVAKPLGFSISAVSLPVAVFRAPVVRQL